MGSSQGRRRRRRERGRAEGAVDAPAVGVLARAWDQAGRGAELADAPPRPAVDREHGAAAQRARGCRGRAAVHDAVRGRRLLSCELPIGGAPRLRRCGRLRHERAVHRRHARRAPRRQLDFLFVCTKPRTLAIPIGSRATIRSGASTPRSPTRRASLRPAPAVRDARPPAGGPPGLASQQPAPRDCVFFYGHSRGEYAPFSQFYGPVAFTTRRATPTTAPSSM